MVISLLLGSLVMVQESKPVLALAKPNPRVLVFTKTTGFRHGSIGAGSDALRQIGAERGLKVEFSEDSQIMSSRRLAEFDVVVFLNTTGDILNPEQQSAFEGFMRQGGGFVGIHSATDTEYDWPFYTEMMGAMFQNHPPGVHQAIVRREDAAHPSTAWLPDAWQVTDEWYNFRTNPRGKVRVLQNLDESTFKGGTMGDHPIVWCNSVGEGRMWYSALGHTDEMFRNPEFRRSLAEAVVWTAQGKSNTHPITAWSQDPGWRQGVWRGKTGGRTVSTATFGPTLLHVEFTVGEGAEGMVWIDGTVGFRLSATPTAGQAQSVGGVQGPMPTPPAPRKAGEVQTLDAVVERGFVREVRLNGVVIARNIEISKLTTSQAMNRPLPARGKIILQSVRGDVEVSKISAKPLP